MKNCQFYHGHHLLSFIEKLWTTDELRNAHKEINPHLWEILEKATKYPICFYEPTDPVERSHFSTFYRYIPLRHYDNLAVNDLYYLHELSHLSTMDNSSCRSCDTKDQFKLWSESMEQSEISASLISEVYVYLWFPTLRQKTFNFEIWVDRFLKQGASFTREWQFKLEGERLRAMTYENEDSIEQYIHKYFLQNKLWAEIWKESFGKVNKNLKLFERMYDMSNMVWDYENRNIFRNETCNVLKTFVDDNTNYGVPFRKEAQEFSIYLGNSVKTMFKV